MSDYYEMENPRGRQGLWIAQEVFELDIPIAGKVLWAEIDSLYQGALSIGKPGCFKSNEKLGEDLGISEKYVEKLIKMLKDRGFLEQVGFDGRRRYLRAIREPRMDRQDAASEGQESARETEEEAGSYPGGTEGPTPVGGRVLPEEGHRIHIEYTEKESISATQREPPRERFEALWKRRVSGKSRDRNKDKAWTQYKIKIKAGFTPDEIDRAYDNFAEQMRAERRDEQYIKQLRFFFSEKGLFESYLSEPEEEERPVFECPKCRTMVEVDPVEKGFTSCPTCGTLVRDFATMRRLLNDEGGED